MTSALISEYVAGLRRGLPAAIADEAADGLLEAYEQRLACGAGDEEAARAALAEFGEPSLVIAEFARQAPGRRASRLLLATGPVAGACWATALILGRAWAWPVPGAARLAFGSVLILAITALAVAAASQRSYRRTRLTAFAAPVLLALDATAITAVMLAGPAMTWALAIAVAASLTRMSFILWALPRFTVR